MSLNMFFRQEQKMDSVWKRKENWQKNIGRLGVDFTNSLVQGLSSKKQDRFYNFFSKFHQLQNDPSLLELMTCAHLVKLSQCSIFHFLNKKLDHFKRTQNFERVFFINDLAFLIIAGFWKVNSFDFPRQIQFQKIIRHFFASSDIFLCLWARIHKRFYTNFRLFLCNFQ